MKINKTTVHLTKNKIKNLTKSHAGVKTYNVIVDFVKRQKTK